MIASIRTHFLDILAADSALLAGSPVGSPVTVPAFPSAIYVTNANIVPQRGSVNIFPHSLEEGAFDRRPAIYIGQPGNTGVSRVDPAQKPSQDGGGYSYYEIFTIPIVAVHIDPDPIIAESYRDQLMMNIETVMLKHLVEQGYWYLLQQSTYTSRAMPTGGGMQSATEALAQRDFEIYFQRNAGTTLP